jgi:hypothetical protein
MGSAGRQRVKEFSSSAVVPRYEMVYQELAAKYQRKRAASFTHNSN